MQTDLRFTRLSRRIRQSLIALLLFSFPGYSLLPSHSSSANLANDSNGLASVGNNAPPQKKKDNKKNRCANCSPPGDQVIYIPLTDLPEAHGGELVFNSRSTKEIAVTPTFYKRNGAAIVGDPVFVKSAEIRYADLKTLIPHSYRNENDWGGLSLSYYGSNREMWSQFRFLSINGGSNVDEFFTVKDELRSDTQEAVWWMPRHSSAIIALGNITDVPTGATVNFGDGDSRTINLAPHATEIIRHHRTGDAGSASVAITITGMPGSVIPSGVIASKDGSFNSAIRFYDTKRTKQPKLFANGLRLSGITPHMVLKNTTPSSLTAQPKFIPPGGIAASPFVLPEIKLGPNELIEVDLTALSQVVRNRNDLDVVSVEVANSGAPGSLIGALYGINNQSGMNYDTPLRDSGPIRTMTGAYPWKIQDDYKTVVYLTNITDQEAEFVAQINYEGGKFIMSPRKLKAGETAAFDLEKMRNERVTDSEGRSLPKAVSIGQFYWAVRGVTNGKIVLIGRAEMVSRTQQISTSYSCQTDCGLFYDVNLNPFPGTVVIDGSEGAATWETGTSNAGYSIGPYKVGAEWTADNPIVRFDAPTTSDYTVMITGMDVGTANLTAFVGWQDRYDFDGLNCIWVDSERVETSGTTAVLPRIDSVSPSRALIGQPVDVVITGRGFGNSPSVSADSGITVSIQSSSDSQIRARFTIAGNDVGGNHAVIVTNTFTGQSATPFGNFFVQYPASLRRGSLSDIIEIVNGNVIDGLGNTRGTNKCGDYRNVVYQLMDQGNPAQPIMASLELDEVFSNYQGPPSLNPGSGKFGGTFPDGRITDVLGVVTDYPSCPGPFSFSFTQKFTVVIGTRIFTLTTTNAVAMSYDGQDWIINVNMTNP